MRILVLSFYYQPDLCAGSFRTTAFVKALKSHLSDDDSIDILTTMPNRYKSFRRGAETVERDGNVTVTRIQLPCHKSGFVDQACAFSRYMIEVIRNVRGKKYDVVFATSSRLFTAFLGALVAKVKHAKLYLDLRDIFTDTMYSLLPARFSIIVLPFFKLIEKFTVKSANRINLVSEGFRDYFQQVAPTQKYSFFTNGIDQEFVGQSFEKSTNESVKIITYAGNIGQGQGLEQVVPDMAEYLGDAFKICIIGDGGMRAILENELVRRKIRNVEIFDPVGRVELMEYYRQSDYLFLHLNDCDAFKKVLPSKIFEYAATGKPMIAGVNGYARDFIKDNIEGAMVFNPCDVVDFSNSFVNWSYDYFQRDGFVSKYRRDYIMYQMALDFAGIMV